MPVHRTEMSTRDMDVFADLLSQRYVEHRASFRCAAPAQVDAGVRAATAGPLEAAVVRHRGFDCRTLVSPPDEFIAWVALHGTGTLATARERVHFTRGGVLLDPIDLQFAAILLDCAFALVRVPRQVVGELAEEHVGLPAAGLRFESMARCPARPVHCGRRRLGSSAASSSAPASPRSARWWRRRWPGSPPPRCWKPSRTQ